MLAHRFKTPSVYIVAIAWLYVTLLMAATEPSLVRGVLTFVFYGLGPLALLLWLMGGPRRRRDRFRRERASDGETVSQLTHQPDGGHAQANEQGLEQGIGGRHAAVQAGDEVGHGHIEHARGGDGHQ
jgi:hypothetical protein